MENYKLYEQKLDQFLCSISEEKIIKFENSEAYGLAVLSCEKHFYGRFLRSLLTAKRKITQLIQSSLPSLKATERNQLKAYLKSLVLEPLNLLNEGILSLYLYLVDFCKKQQSKQVQNGQNTSSQLVQLLKSITKSLNSLLLFYFVNRQYKRRVNIISPYFISSRSKIRTVKIILDELGKKKESSQQNQNIFLEIQKEFSILTVSQLIDKYLKEEENKVIDSIEVCKVCSQKMKLRNFQKHMKNCSKKAKLKECLKLLQEKRKKLYEEIEQFQKDLMLKSSEITQAERQMLRILDLIKEAFETSKKKGALKRNTFFSTAVRDPLQQLKQQVEIYEQCYQKSPLLHLLIKNKEEIISAKKRLSIVEIAFDSEARCLNNSQIQSFKSLQSSINNVMSSNFGFKTKKSLFASKHSQDQKGKKGTITIKTPGSCSSISIQASEESSNSLDSLEDQGKDSEKFGRLENSAYKQELSKSRRTEQLSRSAHITKSLRDTWNLNSLEDQTMGLSDFQILKFLGKGAYGRVYLVRRKSTNDLYALKHIKLERTNSKKEFELIKKQHEIFKKIAGDHLIRAPFAFTQSYGHFFVLQFMPGGDLSKILSQEVYLSEEQAKFYLAEIILAVEHLHKCDIIHRDLKPENIVIDKNGHIKLTDFGLSDIKIQDKIVKAKAKGAESHKKTPAERSGRRVALVNRTDIGKIIGTPDYIAPEIINQTSINNQSIDWWSLGVIAYQMLVGCGPFTAMTVDEVLNNILQCKIQWPAIGREQEMMSPEAYDLISKFLDKNFQRRIGSSSCEEIKSHPFFKQVDWENIKNTNPPILPKKEALNIKQYLDMPEDMSLRQQIINYRQSQPQKTKICFELQNFVRYDVLLEETYESIDERIKRQKRKMQRIKTIGTFIEDEEKQNIMNLKENIDNYEMKVNRKQSMNEFNVNCLIVDD